MSDYILEIKNLSKTFGEKKVLNNVNLSVKAGEIYGFVGHNGAGKSTTIKQVVGALSIDDGEILIDGVDITKDPVACKQIMSYVPDNPDIYDYLTGIQYLNFIGDMFGVDSDQRSEKIKTLTKTLEIDKDLGDLISAYSHGMRQKLVIVGALLHNPKLLVLDEPFVGLDPMAAYNVKEILKEICKSGSSVFFSSHVLDVVEKLCDEIAIIKSGVILKSGKTEDVTGDESLEEVFIEMAKAGDTTNV